MLTFFSHSPSWTTMHLYQISIIASSVSCIVYLELLCMLGQQWMDRPEKESCSWLLKLLANLMIKEQGGTSVALWTTNHTTERQQDYWTEVNCFSQPRHSTCSFSENIYTFKDFSLMSPERTTNKWRLYFQGIFSWSYCAIFPQGTMKFHYSDEQWEYKVDHNMLYCVT